MIERLSELRSTALMVGILTIAGCGGGDGGGGAADSGGAAAAPAASPVDAATAGNVAGMVTFSGTAPTMATIDMASEATCAAKHSSPPMEETFVSEGGGLGNVFVYVKEGLESLTFPTPTASVPLDQDGCVYIPHVVGVQTGQSLGITNSDGLLHNINASPTENRPFNVSQPVNMETARTFPAPEIMIPVVCNVHGWMQAYIGVVDHPYFAVTGPDGSVSLDGLPPGDYVVEAWHEQFGTMTTNVTVATGETAEISFEFTDAMAGNHVPLGEPIDLMHPEGHRAVDHDH